MICPYQPPELHQQDAKAFQKQRPEREEYDSKRAGDQQRQPEAGALIEKRKQNKHRQSRHHIPERVSGMSTDFFLCLPFQLHPD